MCKQQIARGYQQSRKLFMKPVPTVSTGVWWFDDSLGIFLSVYHLTVGIIYQFIISASVF